MRSWDAIGVLGKRGGNHCVILNRSLTRALKSQASHEALTGSNPNVEIFMVFECLTYKLVDSQQRTKFTAKSKLYVLIGYCNRSKAY